MSGHLLIDHVVLEKTASDSPRSSWCWGTNRSCRSKHRLCGIDPCSYSRGRTGFEEWPPTLQIVNILTQGFLSLPGFSASANEGIRKHEKDHCQFAKIWIFIIHLIRRFFVHVALSTIEQEFQFSKKYFIHWQHRSSLNSHDYNKQLTYIKQT